MPISHPMVGDAPEVRIAKNAWHEASFLHNLPLAREVVLTLREAAIVEARMVARPIRVTRTGEQCFGEPDVLTPLPYSEKLARAEAGLSSALSAYMLGDDRAARAGLDVVFDLVRK